MKYVSLALSAAALIFSLFVFTKMNSGSANSREESAETADSELISESLQNSSSSSSLKIAFIDIDTLVSNYDHHKKLRDKLESKIKRAEGEFEKRVKGFEENVKFFEQQANSLSQAEIERAQMELGGMQQEIMQLREQKMQELLEEETKLNKQVKDEVDEMVKGISKELGLDFVLFKEASGVLVHGNEEFDITAMVTKRLNDKYRSEQEEVKK